MLNKPFPEARVLSALQNANSLLLCTHISPDGDALGSLLAMGMALETLGKEVTLACADPVPEKYAFLPGAERIVGAEALTGRRFDLALALDVAEEKRMGDCAAAFFAAPLTAQMDHHPTNPAYAALNAVDGEAAATGCLVYRAMTAWGIPLSPQTAACLYAAISTDTGNYSFRNTDAEAFAITAELMEAGLALDSLARHLHLLRETPHVRLLGRALCTLRLFGGGRCACLRLTPADYQAAEARQEHSDKIVNYALYMPGVEMAYLADERKPGQTKFSLRALPPRDVVRIAAKFSGGGHVLAAGCAVDLPLEQACAQMNAEFLAQLEEKA